MWRRRAVAVTVAATAFVLAARACSFTAAPVTLTAIEPANGSVSAAGPTGVSLVFTAPVDSHLVHVTVGDPGGVSVISGTPSSSGPRVVVPVTVAATGEYVIDYHVAFSDGREASGRSGFTVTGGTAGMVVAHSGSTGRAPADQVAATGGHAHGGKDPLSLALVLVDAALIVAVAGLLLRRPRTR